MRTRSVLRKTAPALLVLSLVVPAAGADHAANTAPWDVVPTPNPESGAARLKGVVAIAPDDAWAVGLEPFGYKKNKTLTEHWDGQEWSVVPSPNPAGATDAWLGNVAAASSDEVWAVGATTLSSGATETLIERWDGTSWAIVSSPNIGNTSKLRDVEVVTSTDVWAVGESGSGPNIESIILRWDGAAWTTVANSCPFALYGITAIAPDDVWAVGYQHSCHWDGRKWSKVPIAPYDSATIVDVSAAAPDDVWAVGNTWVCPYECWTYGVIRHWDGSSWRTFLSKENMSFAGVEAVSSTEVYAVGGSGGPAVILLWDGHRWKEAPDPAVRGGFADVSANSADDMWAVGTTISSGPPTTLAERAPSPTSGAVTGNTGRSGTSVSWFGPESGTTEVDDAGVYVAAGLSPGTYDLFATKSGCDPARATVTISVGSTLSQDLRVTC